LKSTKTATRSASRTQISTAERLTRHCSRTLKRQAGCRADHPHGAGACRGSVRPRRRRPGCLQRSRQIESSVVPDPLVTFCPARPTTQATPKRKKKKKKKKGPARAKDYPSSPSRTLAAAIFRADTNRRMKSSGAAVPRGAQTGRPRPVMPTMR